MLYILNIYNFCQSYLHKAGGKKREKITSLQSLKDLVRLIRDWRRLGQHILSTPFPNNGSVHTNQ